MEAPQLEMSATVLEEPSSVVLYKSQLATRQAGVPWLAEPTTKAEPLMVVAHLI